MVKPEKGLVVTRLLVCKNHPPGLVHGSSSVQVSIIVIIIVIITIIIVVIITIIIVVIITIIIVVIITIKVSIINLFTSIIYSVAPRSFTTGL